jgi:hypothetical protein
MRRLVRRYHPTVMRRGRSSSPPKVRDERLAVSERESALDDVTEYMGLSHPSARS